ncbi:MAG: hypothetical protein M1526_02190 [Candidatus Thermoplasmatota archaeon]|jgi:hypothetical protein|nr:hypothetical protein [Candidatus Thermoplasmatota archaeon]
MTIEEGQYETPISDGDVEQFFVNRLMTPISVDDFQLHFNISREQAYREMDRFRNRHPNDCFWSDRPPHPFYVRPSVLRMIENEVARNNAVKRRGRV